MEKVRNKFIKFKGFETFNKIISSEIIDIDLNINKIPEYEVGIFNFNFNEIDISEELIIQNKPCTDFYSCKICLNIIHNPKMCYECENFFCGQCIDNNQLYDKQCPNCRKPFVEIKILKQIKTILNRMVIKCPLKCEENINYENIESHLKSCKNAPKLNKCKLCQIEIITKNFQDNSEIKKHNEECSQILFNCNFCKKEIIKKDFDSHIISCRKILITCEICKINIPKNLIGVHDKYYCNLLCNLNKLFKEITNRYII